MMCKHYSDIKVRTSEFLLLIWDLLGLSGLLGQQIGKDFVAESQRSSLSE
jgi:hypothetical protein